VCQITALGNLVAMLPTRSSLKTCPRFGVGNVGADIF
jgi:hypothetical protein